MIGLESGDKACLPLTSALAVFSASEDRALGWSCWKGQLIGAQASCTQIPKQVRTTGEVSPNDTHVSSLAASLVWLEGQ